jgi:hypothetical protein
VEATIRGVLLGTFLGTRIGREVCLIDELKTAEALESSCDDTGKRHSVPTAHTYQRQPGRCRDFMPVSKSQGFDEVIHGTA